MFDEPLLGRQTLVGELLERPSEPRNGVVGELRDGLLGGVVADVAHREPGLDEFLLQPLHRALGAPQAVQQGDALGVSRVRGR